MSVAVTFGTGGFHVGVGPAPAPGQSVFTSAFDGFGGIDPFELLLYGIQFRNALRRLRRKPGMTGELEIMLIADSVANPNLHAEIPLATIGEDWGEALELGLLVYVGTKRLKAAGQSGVIRTKLSARSVDDPDLTAEVPFFSIIV